MEFRNSKCSLTARSEKTACLIVVLDLLGAHISERVMADTLLSTKCNLLGVQVELEIPQNPLIIRTAGTLYEIQVCIQKFPDWPPGARTVNGTALCH
jgi:hypothetical protein